jgi:hypothetical protein
VGDDDKRRLIDAWSARNFHRLIDTTALFLPNVAIHDYSLDEFDPAEGWGDVA